MLSLGARRTASAVRSTGHAVAARSVSRRDGHAAGRARTCIRPSPPRPQGGNIDCKELVAGTTLYLPIPVDGALFSAGDGHAAQGDGEVSGTAIETHVARAADASTSATTCSSSGPCARIDGAWLTFGFDADLDRGRLRRRTRACSQLLERERRARRVDEALAARERRRRPARDAARERGARRARGASRRRARMTERLRLWLERDRRGAGYHLRDAATGERVEWEDPRIRVIAVAGVSFRPEAVDRLVVRSRCATRARAGARERARPERDRHLERGSGRCRPATSRARPRRSWRATSSRSRSGAPVPRDCVCCSCRPARGSGGLAGSLRLRAVRVQAAGPRRRA